MAVCPFGDPNHPHTYIIDREALRRALPHCQDCSRMNNTAPRKQQVFISASSGECVGNHQGSGLRRSEEPVEFAAG